MYSFVQLSEAQEAKKEIERSLKTYKAKVMHYYTFQGPVRSDSAGLRTDIHAQCIPFKCHFGPLFKLGSYCMVFF